VLNPVETYLRLSEISSAPFGAYYKLNDKYLLCSSPERFMKKAGNKLISQPIKGTIKRGGTDEEDIELKHSLLNDVKERAENVMIVDLVRNDLAKSCRPGSVKVEELFGIYTYPTVHQMISTVTGELDEQTHFIDALRNAFPMGSMTGAPKIEVMKLIEYYETTKRGLFSGSVGYITPDGDFDFNVVIRSLFYNEANKYLSYSTGGAITYDSIPEKEYEECMLKAKGIMKALGS
jgi:para-aminobenzoate synthetase component 1